MPNVDASDVAVASKDADIVQLLEQYLSDWGNQIAAILEREGDKVPSGKGPLSEIEFWRGRLGLFSSVFEQLNTQQVRTPQGGSTTVQCTPVRIHKACKILHVASQRHQQ